MILELTEEECDFLRGVLARWVDEGFTTPPYQRVFYDVAEELGLTQADVQVYDIRRPS